MVLSVLQGDLGKPRPAVVVQADELATDRLTVVICPIASHLDDTPAFRPVIAPSSLNGLRERSMVMTDKVVAVRRERLRAVIGVLESENMRKVDQALFFVLGLGRVPG